MRTREQIEKACGEPLPREAVAERSQSGRTLSYVEGHYVRRRLCHVFGPLAWDETILVQDLTCAPYETPGKNGGSNWRVGYRAIVRLTVRYRNDDGTIETCFKDGDGSGQGIDKDQILAHESALKEASTDALKRAAINLGDSFGLALYDKEQTNVEDTADRVLRLIAEGDVEGARTIAREHKASMGKDDLRRLASAFKAAERRGAENDEGDPAVEAATREAIQH